MFLNGRALGDSTGKYTCHQPGGSSVVDYGIVEDELFHKINYLRVHEYQPELSDHCQLSTQIKTWYKFTDTKLTLKNMPPKYTWNNESKQMFSLALQAPNSQEKIDSFLNNPTQDTNVLAGDLEEIIISAANNSLKIKRNQTSKKNKKWFNNDCWRMKRELKRLSKLILKQPFEETYE